MKGLDLVPRVGRLDESTFDEPAPSRLLDSTRLDSTRLELDSTELHLDSFSRRNSKFRPSCPATAHVAALLPQATKLQSYGT